MYCFVLNWDLWYIFLHLIEICVISNRVKLFVLSRILTYLEPTLDLCPKEPKRKENTLLKGLSFFFFFSNHFHIGYEGILVHKKIILPFHEFRYTKVVYVYVPK